MPPKGFERQKSPRVIELSGSVGMQNLLIYSTIFVKQSSGFYIIRVFTERYFRINNNQCLVTFWIFGLLLSKGASTLLISSANTNNLQCFGVEYENKSGD